MFGGPRTSLVSVAFVGALLGALILVSVWWFIGQYARDQVQTTVVPTQEPRESPTATASGHSIAAGGNVVVIGITPEQYEAGLKRKEQEIRNELTQAPPTDKAKLESRLDDTQAKLQNREAALADYRATLEQASQALDKMEGEFSPQELAQAYEGLETGDPSNAETLFRRILAVSGSTVSVVGSREKAFTAAHILAQLAEGHGDYQAALRYKDQAMQWKPSGDTAYGYGLVGDDAPKVIVALNTMQFSTRTISGIHEATGVSESAIMQTVQWLEKDGLAAKSGTDMPYWSLTLKGREAFADLK
jgi:tetratricopeptide (TPR) repeat protein